VITLPQALHDVVYGGNVQAVADLFTITLANGTVLRWTNYDQSLTFGGTTWTNPGIVLNTPTARRALGLEVATVRVSLVSATVTIGGVPVQQAAASGALDEARVEIQRTYMAVPGTVPGTVLRFSGEVSDVEPGSLTVNLAIRSDTAKLDETLPRRITAAKCPYAIYSPQCGATKGGAFTTTRQVATGSTRKRIVLSASMAANVTVDGWIEFTSGALEGKSATIGALVPGGTDPTTAVDLYLPLPSTPEVGDTIVVVRGCNKTRTDCAVFGRTVAYGGTPEMPREEST
jgi:uncharacterized phage protein (TIGR02218 family)